MSVSNDTIGVGTRVLMKARHPHEGRTGAVVELATKGVALGMYLIKFDDSYAGSAYGFREDFKVIDDA